MYVCFSTIKVVYILFAAWGIQLGVWLKPLSLLRSVSAEPLNNLQVSY